MAQIRFELVLAGLLIVTGCGDDGNSQSNADAGTGVPVDAGPPPSFEGCLQSPLWPVDPTHSVHWDVDGPPRVLQTFVRGSSGTKIVAGQHPVLPTEPAHMIRPHSASLSLVLDEPLKASSMYEVQCVDGSYSRIPDGTSSADTQACLEFPYDECTEVCMGKDGPIGIQWDGITRRMIDYAKDPSECQPPSGYGNACLPPVQLVCNGVVMPIGARSSGYSLYGSQQFDVQGVPILAVVPRLGPMVQLSVDDLPTSATCNVVFMDHVTDCDGNTVDTTTPIQFNVEPLTLTDGEPVDTAINVPVNSSLLYEFNAYLDQTTADAITLEAGGQPVPATVVVAASDGRLIFVIPTNPLAPNTVHMLTIPAELADVMGGTLGAPIGINFTTGPSS